MNILVLDKFDQRRDPAQMDMYEALMEGNVVYKASSYYLYEHLPFVDVLYLGIYHQILPIDYNELFSRVKCPVIIDQADNEDFIRRMPNMKYDRIKPSKVFLSRYLPHKTLQSLIPDIKQLSWYVSPDRVKYNGENKDIDVAFVCSIYKQRHEYAQVIKSICAKNGWKCFVGTAWGDEYYNILRRSKVFIAECSRKCYTQKYTEASLCGCTIVGDRPSSPENMIVMYDATLRGLEPIISLALDKPMKSTPEFADKDYFLKEFDSILSEL